MFFYDKYLPRLLDLETDQAVPPELPTGLNIGTRYLGWRGDPSRLYVLVDTFPRGLDAFYEPDSPALLQSEIRVVSKDGRLIETRPAAELAAFRREKVFVRAPYGTTFMTSSMPVAWGDLVLVSRRVHDNLLPRNGLPDGTPQGATLSYNFVTGQTRVHKVSDSSRHVAFSPDLDWEIRLDGPVSEGRTVSCYGWTFLPRIHLSLTQDPKADGPPTPLPGLSLEGEDVSLPISSFAENAKSAEVTLEFLHHGRVLFALVQESAKSELPGFAKAVLETSGGDDLTLGPRRVRAIAPDLQELKRSEAPLPPSMMGFFVAPGQDRIFCHNPLRVPPWETRTWDCVILRLPGLEEVSATHWPGGTGPLFGYVGMDTAFLGTDTIVTLMRIHGEGMHLRLWRIGEQPPVWRELSPPAESES